MSVHPRLIRGTHGRPVMRSGAFLPWFVVLSAVVAAGASWSPGSPAEAVHAGTPSASVDPGGPAGSEIGRDPGAPTQGMTVDSAANGSNSTLEWRQLHPVVTPGPLADAGLTYYPPGGYMLLLGGVTSFEQAGALVVNCTNATWVYQGGEWRNLSIPGPPTLWTCNPLLEYDPSSGTVVAFLLSERGDHPETWEFAQGAWSRLPIWSPDVFGALSYDSEMGALILFGPDWNTSYGNDSMWQFTDGNWSQVSYSPAGFNPWGNAQFPTLTYDASTGALLLLQGIVPRNSSTPGTSAWVTETWAFAQGVWQRAALFPEQYDQGGGALVYDPAEGFDVEFGGLGRNTTWIFEDGGWFNASVGGPTNRGISSMAFDPAIDSILLYGGLSYGAGGVPDVHSDTWTFGAPPLAATLSESVDPGRICSAVSMGCPFDSDRTTVTLSVSVEAALPGTSYHTDRGTGEVVYGPFDWAQRPTLNFVSQGNLVPAGGADVQVRCEIGGVPSGPCNSTAQREPLPTGATLLRWSWGGAELTTAFRGGDRWTVTFPLVSLGPPFGTVPVDRCATATCEQTEGPAPGPFTSVSYSLDGAVGNTSASFPMTWLTVLSNSSAASGPPAPPAPSPPPPPVAAPPVPAPVSASPTATPAAGGVALGLSALISPSAAAAGILVAGITRAVLRRSPVAVRLASPLPAAALRRRDRGG